MANVILSIKPKYADAIFSGKKKVEFRKKLFQKKINKIYVYSSSPVKKIIGYFTVSEIIKNTPENLWDCFSKSGCISEKDFFKYFENKSFGFSICIKETFEFSNNIDPYKFFKKFYPPQSYMYIRNFNGEM